MRTKFAALTGAVAIGALAAACSSSPTKTSGTLTITGTANGAAAAANFNNPNQNAPLVFSTFTYAGPVSATVSNYKLPGGQSKVGQPQTGTLANGLSVTHTATYQQPDNQPPALLKTIPAGGSVGPDAVCVFSLTFEKGTYVVNGSKSTGKFKGATGHGTYAVSATIGARMPAGKNTCNIADYGQNGPTAVATGSSILFKASGPLTASSGG